MEKMNKVKVLIVADTIDAGYYTLQFPRISGEFTEVSVFADFRVEDGVYDHRDTLVAVKELAEVHVLRILFAITGKQWKAQYLPHDWKMDPKRGTSGDVRYKTVELIVW